MAKKKKKVEQKEDLQEPQENMADFNKDNEKKRNNSISHIPIPLYYIHAMAMVAFLIYGYGYGDLWEIMGIYNKKWLKKRKKLRLNIEKLHKKKIYKSYKEIWMPL